MFKCSWKCIAEFHILMMQSDEVNVTNVKVTQSNDWSWEKAEQEFVKIIIIVVVMTVMVVVIICLLNHYKLLTRSFINRQSQDRRQEEALQPNLGYSYHSDNRVIVLSIIESAYEHVIKKKE
ncbi:hypothetical protein scyTo_0015452 [Scyliorhinus torazame]|uniref:Uncharacterized protein n=1 Tax=Scyliorhinus torazame TaxID=75743 RepID=A0A401PSX0_SCYTO|nr:hypothetical protein [Scyliorhinus torazame]